MVVCRVVLSLASLLSGVYFSTSVPGLAHTQSFHEDHNTFFLRNLFCRALKEGDEGCTLILVYISF